MFLVRYYKETFDVINEGYVSYSIFHDLLK